LGCGGDGTASITAVPPVVPGPPELRAANSIVASSVGAAVDYDATQNGQTFTDPAGKGLSYTASFSPAANGLTLQAGHVRGTPTVPTVTLVTLSATDGLARTVTDHFTIVTFAAGLLKPTLPTVTDPYSDEAVPLPAHFVAPGPGSPVSATDNTPPNNRTTDAGATLGRVLFYDPRLSANDKVSCGSCHKQSLGFADTTALSRGILGGLTARHTPGISNARFYQRGRFFWDEAAVTLEAQVLVPIQNPVEMGMTLDALELKLKAAGYYESLFQAAFGNKDMTRDQVSRALSQYVRALVSSGSKFDRAFAGGGQPNFPGVFTLEEQRGERVFRDAGCVRCHATNAQVSDDTHNTGLDATITDAGAGNGRFKSPSLRNVAIRAPYMHDGRFATLEQVVEFYNSGVQANPGLDQRLRTPNGSPQRLGLSSADKAALVAFMRTLTDSSIITAQRFSNPFR
jgi:cytochrome c peroxidase